MAKKFRSKHIMLRKIMAGIMLTCFLVYIFGQVNEGVSAKSMMIWSSVLMIFMGICCQVLLRLWAAWEEISEKPNKGSKP